MWIYRPIIAGKCTLDGVLSGLITLDDILELNAVLDAVDAYQGYAQEQAEKRRK